MLKPLDRKPDGLFAGQNFMTRDVLAYYKLRKNLGYAELSQGEGMSRQPIFGVTVQPTTGLSKVFQSRREAEKYIESLSD